ncbi:hypothetical protein RHMOL_Rhmol02G0191900 [Rhododendron molle]|uniref:Uncharacterized protein n=1 Tax=Rhododendron molle TaxID=49168 RepID=A0ACC0PUY7_RHOML|nr:hypothetical protein RHMOL_Rhmol02G0191900 [Rhododendron molle]
MPGHTTDNCIRLRQEIQNLIDNKVVDAPPSDKPNTISNPLPQHNSPFRLNQITLAKNQNLPEFDPTLFIVPDTEPRPVVEIPEETALCFLWEWEDTWGELITDWEELEAANFQRNDDPLFEAGWEVNWQNIHADPLDGFSLYALFENQVEAYQVFQEMPEWGWDPTPDEYCFWLGVTL